MNVTLLVPVAGLLECWVGTDTLPHDTGVILDGRDGKPPYIKVELHKDDDYMGTVIFGVPQYPDSAPNNARAATAVTMLSGTYLMVPGPALFTGITERQADRLLMEFSR